MATSTGKIFISYRRDDSASDTGRIYDRLVQEFGRDNIFKDVDSIPFGVDFAQYIDQEVGRCQVLLVVMGKNWITPRLQNPDDFVRLEIESALGRNIPVVPVFLEGVTAPPPRDQLPESLHPLIRRNGTQVGHDPRFHADMDRLVKRLREIPFPEPAPSRRYFIQALGLVSLGGIALKFFSTDNTATGTPPPAPTQPVQPQDSPEPASTYRRFSFEVVTVNPQGQITNRKQASAPCQILDLGQGVTLDMVLIPGGSFMMGSPDSEPGRFSDESFQHQVTLPGFWMGKYPITQAQYQAIVGNNPARFKGNNRPVEQVSWHDAIDFCDRLSQKLGQPYTLPSEAQWEYACRAGTTTPFYFGETITTDLANYRGTDWEYEGNTYPGFYGQGPRGAFREQTTDVGSFPPNGFGLYDMHGNLWDWCLDHWHDSYKGAPADGTAWVTDDANQLRLVRGGSWYVNPVLCRSADRGRGNPDGRSDNVGFRVVCAPPGLL